MYLMFFKLYEGLVKNLWMVESYKLNVMNDLKKKSLQGHTSENY